MFFLCKSVSGLCFGELRVFPGDSGTNFSFRMFVSSLYFLCTFFVPGGTLASIRVVFFPGGFFGFVCFSRDEEFLFVPGVQVFSCSSVMSSSVNPGVRAFSRVRFIHSLVVRPVLRATLLLCSFSSGEAGG